MSFTVSKFTASASVVGRFTISGGAPRLVVVGPSADALTAMGDPGADRIVGWDESAGKWVYFTLSTGLTITDTTITASSGSSTLDGLDDVVITSVADGEALVYDSGTSKWVNTALAGTGTVTSFSAGDLSPLFTTSEATATTTPALTFTAVNQNANIVYAGPTTGSAAAPTFRSLVAADIPDLSGTYLTDVVEDTTPQLGGDLDLNGFDITSDGDAGSLITLTTSYDATYAPFSVVNKSTHADASAGISLTSGTGASINIYSSHNTATTYIYGSTGALLIGTGGNTSFKIQTGLTDRVTISGDGNTITLEDAAAWRTGLGGTTVGQSFFTLTNPGAVTFPRMNADNTVTALSASDFRTAIGAGTSSFDGAYSSLSSIPSTFAPSAHATSHQSGGTDAIKLDDLAAPDDNTDLNATASAHGLLPKLSNSATEFLNGKGAWATPAGGGDIATDSIWAAAGDIVQGTGNDTAAVLSIGTAGQLLRVNAGATALEYYTPSGVSGVTDGDTLTTGLTFPNTGLHILDTNASHDLIIAPGSNLTADRTLTVTTGDSDRTLTMTGNASIEGTNTGDQTNISGTAAIATTVTVADTTDETCSVALFESATGDLGPKTDGGITYNAKTAALTVTGSVNSDAGIFSGSVNVGDNICDPLATTWLIAVDGSAWFGTNAFTISSTGACTAASFTTAGNVNLSNTSTLIFQDGAADNTVTFGIPNSDRTNSTIVLFSVNDAAATYTLTIGGNVTLTAGTTIVSGGALGTPSSGTVTNLTGTASININGTVGATTPAAGTFTTIVAGSATSLLVGTAGSAVGSVGFRNATSGTITLAPTTGALGTVTQTLQAVTGTVYCTGGTDVAVADGGTGASTLTANNVILGNGTSAVQFVAPGTSGNVLTSNGTTWTSAAAATGSGDLLATLTSAEISVTTTATATISRMHVCSGTTSDYTVTLPAASGNTGKLIGFRMATGLTKIVTIDGDSSETIDGAASRKLWAGESCVLLCDGSNWFKIAGKTIPMVCQLYKTAGQNVSSSTVTKIALDAASIDTGAMGDTSNNRITTRRAGNYEVSGSIYYTTALSGGQMTQCRIHLNGSERKTVLLYSQGTNFLLPFVYEPLALAAGDYVELNGYQDSGSTLATDTATATRPELSLAEIPSW